jgi:hypothetical protein
MTTSIVSSPFPLVKFGPKIEDRDTKIENELILVDFNHQFFKNNENHQICIYFFQLAAKNCKSMIENLKWDFSYFHIWFIARFAYG